MKKAGIVKYVFSLVGLGMLVGAGFLITSTNEFINAAVSANGEVIGLESRSSDDGTTYAPIVEFTTADRQRIEFTSSSSSNPPAYSTGEAVEVLYLADNPLDAKINGFMDLWFGSLMLVVMGGIFTAIGGGMVLFPVFKQRKQTDLRQTGMRIQTDFQRADVDESYSVNGKHPYRIYSQWQNPQTNEIHVFESDAVWFDPLDYIKTDKMDVWIDRDDPGRYFMDISFLPKLAD